MAIQVGQIVDKYELIEKVGQGGMAVVYRGLDRTLQREVAIKVLHGHLADHAEARDRFEREARAVAKLQHENIVEIFDFSRKDSGDSYIVTEFIEGQTLKEFIEEHRIGFAEIGAMIILPVCRALAHAHGAGILHRDIKPENIMIRDDGAVKLMDFGIAQMLDMQRMTVTGQLLGSPAYMAPELLEGDQLDFRTDVFAVGIVLYQLVTGVLPFRGKNPHEILKRIAECKYEDPRQCSPRVGKELGRIITTALARLPDDRYRDISECSSALEQYLEASGVSEQRQELARFFKAPRSYESAFEVQLLDHLSGRGKQLVDSDPVAALEYFNRVLTIAPEHREVLAAIDEMSRRRRWLRTAAIFGAVLAVGLVVLLLWRMRAPDSGAEGESAMASNGPDAGDMALPRESPSAPDDARALATTAVDAGALGDVHADAHIEVLMDARGEALAERADAGRRRPVTPRITRPPQRPSADAGAVEVTPPRQFALAIVQRGSEYRVDEGEWRKAVGEVTLRVGPGAHLVEVRNRACCEIASRTIGAAARPGKLSINLGYLPARITPRCGKKAVQVQVDGRPAQLDKEELVVIGGSLGTRAVRVKFTDGARTDAQMLKVHYNESKDVSCRFD